MPLRLIQRHPCELCDKMHEALLLQLGGEQVKLQLQDVDQDPQLQRRYGLRVPVLIDPWGEVISEGVLDAEALDDAYREYVAGNSGKT